MLHDPDAMERLLVALSINVTSMFRDPTFYRAFREKVVPLLRTYPFIRIWNAGCATGEETCRWRSCCEEEGLLDAHAHLRDRLQRRRASTRARHGEFPLARMQRTRRTT